MQKLPIPKLFRLSKLEVLGWASLFALVGYFS
jgi:hypothetical protein